MASDVYMKIDGIDGESTDAKHAKWIEIHSFSFGLSNAAQVSSGKGGMTAGKVSISSFNCMKSTDSSSVKLASACASGKHIKSVQVEICATAGDKHTYVAYDFEDVMIESVQWSGSAGGDDRPTESMSFCFAKAKWTYTPLTKDGKSGTKVGPEGWDITKNQKV